MDDAINTHVPVRVQLKRTKGWRMPPNTVKVTRPGVWGNPFVHKDAAVAVEAYSRLCSGGTQRFEMGPQDLLFASSIDDRTLHWHFPQFVRENIHRLRGKNLACWCKPGEPCHADVLLELANTPPPA